MMTKILLGLGNPGVEYEMTRHNVGSVLVDRISEKWGGVFRRKGNVLVDEHKDKDVILVKGAEVFMNESGKMINDLRFLKYDTDNVYAVHDDLDIKIGSYKIQKGVGPKDHRGINSLVEFMGTADFWRIRIGIENRQRDTGDFVQGRDYVLSKFEKSEMELINSVVSDICLELGI